MAMQKWKQRNIDKRTWNRSIGQENGKSERRKMRKWENEKGEELEDGPKNGRKTKKKKIKVTVYAIQTNY